LGMLLIPAGFYQILSTGSRGALVTAALTLLVIAVVSRVKTKIAILLGIPLLGMLAIPLVPTKSAERLASLFRSEQEDTTDATASRMARRRLLEQSITITLTHPIFGVGPGEFMDSEGRLAKESGERGMWHETHNTYTQVSSECGIPAFLCYVTALLFTLVGFWKMGKNSDAVLAGLAKVLFVSGFSFAVATFFLSHAYDFPVLVSGALCVAMQQFLARQIADARDQVPLAQPAIPAQFSGERRLAGRSSVRV
jgi:O-antigen ligase